MNLTSRAMCAVAVLGVTAAAVLPLAGPADAEPDGSGIDTTVFYPSNVKAQFNALSERADALGFGIGSSADPSACKHYQGVARSTGSGRPFLFVTHSRNHTPLGCGLDNDYPGELLVVDMASRADSGERLRSNRLVKGEQTDDSAPPPSDTTTKVITFDGTKVDEGSADNDCNPADGLESWPAYHHPGGVQLVGDVLAVPLEAPINDDCPDSLIVFIDVSDPTNPKLLSGFDPGTADGFGSAGLVAVTELDDHRFLLMAAGGSNSTLRFFRSSGTDLGDSNLTWEHDFDYTEDDIEDDIAPADWPGDLPTDGAYQMMNFVREAGTGQLYLFAAFNSRKDNDGADLLDLYQVNDIDLAFTFVGRRHLVAEPTTGSDNLANFNAAISTYVSPSGNLLLYATEHDNDGPNDTVKAGEWRHHNIVRQLSPTLYPTVDAGGPYTVGEGGSTVLDGTAAPPLTRAWVELYAGSNFDGESVIIDHADRNLDDFNDFTKLDGGGFNDVASTMRFFAPLGCTFQLNDLPVGADGFPGAFSHTFTGDGAVHSVVFVGNDNAISSITWSPNCDDVYNSPASLAWDLNGDTVFETPGAAPAFSAQNLDGPTTRLVTAQATQAASVIPGFDSATVQVSNVAPTLTGFDAVDSLGNPLGPLASTPFVLAGLPVTVTGSFSDPGAADTHVASVTWGDSVVDQGPAVGTFTYTHSYTQSGTYQAVATVTDDDGGTVTVSIAINVVDPAAAIDGIADQLEDLLDDGYSPAVNDALAEALHQLVGGVDGQAASGALDLLQAGDTEAAMVKLIAAVEALQAAQAAGGPSLDAAVDVLGLIGQALAQGAYADAQTAATPGSPGDQKQLGDIADLIDSGKTALVNGEHVDALEDFRAAVRKAEAVIN
jgi:hypothetical protein